MSDVKEQTEEFESEEEEDEGEGESEEDVQGVDSAGHQTPEEFEVEFTDFHPDLLKKFQFIEEKALEVSQIKTQLEDIETKCVQKIENLDRGLKRHVKEFKKW